MNCYPTKVTIFGHKLDVKVITGKFKETTEDGREIHPDTLGYFDPLTASVNIRHAEVCPELGQSTLIHEFIEAANQYGDLQLNHTQISTLASALHQAFHSGGYRYVVAA